MKAIHLFICLLFLCYFPEIVYSQNWRKSDTTKLWDFKIPQSLNKGYTAITVKKGFRPKGTIPSKEAERFKIKFKFEKDTSFFTLKAEKFKYGEHLDDPFYNERIIYWPDLYKGEVVFFELVPDVSLSNKLTLFTYFPQMTSFKFMTCPENKCFKYKIFERPMNTQADSGPLMLIYVDDKESNEVEILVNQHSKNNVISSSPKKYKKLLANIELYMLIHYTIE